MSARSEILREKKKREKTVHKSSFFHQKILNGITLPSAPSEERAHPN